MGQDVGHGDTDPGRLRLAAAVVGASVPTLVAAAAWWLGVAYVAVVAGLGVPIGAVLAALAAGPATRPGWGRVVLGIAVLAPLLVAAVISIAGSGGDGGQLLAGFLFVTLYAELLGMPVTLPTAFIAVALVRRLARMPAAGAARHAAALGLVAALAGIPTLLIAAGPLGMVAADAGIGPVDWAARTATVRLELAIENRSGELRAVDLVVDLGDGSATGTTFYVGPCEAVTDRWNVESARWSLREGIPEERWDEPDGMAWGDGRVLASSADAPGSDPAVRLVLGPGDEVRLEPDVALPSGGPLDPRDCA